MSTKALTRWRTVGGYEWRIEFKLPDLWVGVFWNDGEAWLCLLPCVPLHIRHKQEQLTIGDYLIMYGEELTGGRRKRKKL